MVSVFWDTDNFHQNYYWRVESRNQEEAAAFDFKQSSVSSRQ